MSNVPSALGPVLVTTTQLDQHLGMTGGSSKPDVKEQFRTAIEGSPFEAVRWPRAVHVCVVLSEPARGFSVLAIGGG